MSFGKVAGLWTIRLKDTHANIDREKTYYPNAYTTDDEIYGRALDCYDKTCDAAARMYNTPRPLPEKPNFAKTVNI